MSEINNRALIKGENTALEVISDRQVLSWILHECVEEFTDVPLKVIEQQCLDRVTIAKEPVHRTQNHRIIGDDTADKTTGEGNTFFDIKFTATVPGEATKVQLSINIEIQGRYRPTDKEGNSYELVTRGIYYASRLISMQKGRVFTGSSYQKLQKVYSIWICLRPDVEQRSTISVYEINEHHVLGNVNRKREDYDKLCVVMIRLGQSKNQQEDSKNIADFLTILLSGISKSEKDALLKERYDFIPEQDLEEVVENMSEYGLYRELIGEERGEARGEIMGIEKLQRLLQTLAQDGRYEERERAIVDFNYANQLMQTYGI